MPFFDQDGPGCAKWPKMGFGARFCVESVKMQIFNLRKFFLFQTPLLRILRVPENGSHEQILTKNAQNRQNIGFFENRSGTAKMTYGFQI